MLTPLLLNVPEMQQRDCFERYQQKQNTEKLFTYRYWRIFINFSAINAFCEFRW